MSLREYVGDALRASPTAPLKIVMKVQMSCQKCRTESLKLVAKADGVSFVGLEGAEKDKVVVIGEGVDAVKLATSLRNKVGHTELISVAEQK